MIPFCFFFSRAPYPITGSLLQTQALSSVSLFPAKSWLFRQGEREVQGREGTEGSYCVRALLCQLPVSLHFSVFPRRLWRGCGGSSEKLRAAEILSLGDRAKPLSLPGDAEHAPHTRTSHTRSHLILAPLWGASYHCPYFTGDDAEALRRDLPLAAQ